MATKKRQGHEPKETQCVAVVNLVNLTERTQPGMPEGRSTVGFIYPSDIELI